MKFDFDFLKDRYDYELKRRDQLTAALTLPIGILTALGTVIAAMAQTFSYKSNVLTWGFVFFLVLSVGAFLICVIFITRAYHRQKYWNLPLLGDLQKDRETWRGLYKEIWLRTFVDSPPVADEQVFQWADSYFQDQLDERIIEAADHNTMSNDKRSAEMYWMRLWLFTVLGLAAIAGVLYVFDQVRL